MIQPLAGQIQPNPLQVQQATGPINEVGGNDLQIPEDQRVQPTDQTDGAAQARSTDPSRGQVLDISV